MLSPFDGFCSGCIAPDKGSSHIYGDRFCTPGTHPDWSLSISGSAHSDKCSSHSIHHTHIRSTDGCLSLSEVSCMRYLILCCHQISSLLCAEFCMRCLLRWFLLRDASLLLCHIHHQTLRCRVHFRVLLLFTIQSRSCRRRYVLHTRTAFYVLPLQTIRSRDRLCFW